MQTPDFGPVQQAVDDSTSATVIIDRRGHLCITTLTPDGKIKSEYCFGGENTVLVREMLDRADVDLQV